MKLNSIYLSKLRIKIFLLLISGITMQNTMGQFEGMIVEKYYVSNDNDTMGSFDTTKLPENSYTYRIFVDLADSVRLKSIYADSTHPIEISASQNFFQHSFGDVYGFNIQSSLVNHQSLGRLGLDTWFTIGFATDSHYGILKEKDPDSTIFSNMVLTSQDTAMGISLQDKDGLVLADSAFDGFGIAKPFESQKPFYNDSMTAFFKTYKPVLQSTDGYIAPNEENIILIGQITTSGDIQIKLNLELIKPRLGGSFFDTYHYVSTDTLLGEVDDVQVIFSNELIYPPKAGCMDPYFLCYDPNAVIEGACNCDSIRFGCLDPNACNYDPDNANWHLQGLCCYGPDSCDGRDIDIVCPGYFKSREISFKVFPKPISAQEVLNFELYIPKKDAIEIQVFDVFGTKVLNKKLGWVENNHKGDIIMPDVNSGVYIVRLMTTKSTVSEKIFVE
jgi:hypothetical protein